MKILINRSDAIGDTILTMPMAKLIKDRFPDAIIIFLVSKKSADLFKNHLYIDDCWIFPHEKGFFSKIRFLYKRFLEFKPDIYFHVGGSFLPTWYSWWKRIPFRGGLVSKWQSFLLLNKGTRQKRSVVAMHEAEYNIELLKTLDTSFGNLKREDVSSGVQMTPDELKTIKDDFKKLISHQNFSNDRKFFFVHPGMTGHTLNWAPRNYARLILEFHRQNPGQYVFVVSYTPGDKLYIDGVRDFLNQDENQVKGLEVFYFNGADHGLRFFMGSLKLADFFIGPSTGTTHLANILGVKHIGIYSPIKVQSALRWGPLHREQNSKVLVPDVVCGEQFQCAGRVCPYYECMSKMEVEDILHAVNNLIEVK